MQLLRWLVRVERLPEEDQQRGTAYPRDSQLLRILAGMGVTFAALHRAQELVLDPMGEDAELIDAPDFTPEEAHQSRLRVQCRSALNSCEGQRDAERPEDRFDWRRGSG